LFKKLRELYQYRELLLNLVKRELKIKYKRSVLGFFWSLMNPLLLMLVYTIVFALFLRVDPPIGANGLKNFSAFLLCGLLAWNYFCNSLNASVSSLVDSGSLLKKVYFPREIIPFSAVFANLVNFLIELSVLFVFLLILGNNFLLLTPFLLLVVLIETVLVLGLSLILSVGHLYYRDTKHLLGVVLTLWFFACPIIYPIDLVQSAAAKHNYFWLIPSYKLNPVASIILNLQKIMYSLQLPDWKLFIYTLVVAIIIFAVGYKIFSKFEMHFAEEV